MLTTYYGMILESQYININTIPLTNLDTLFEFHQFLLSHRFPIQDLTLYLVIVCSGLFDQVCNLFPLPLSIL